MLDNIRRLVYPVCFSFCSLLLQYFADAIFEDQSDAIQFLNAFTQMLIFVGIVFGVARFRLPHQQKLILDPPIGFCLFLGASLAIYFGQSLILFLGLLYFIKDYIKLSKSSGYFQLSVMVSLVFLASIVFLLYADIFTEDRRVKWLLFVGAGTLCLLCSFLSFKDIHIDTAFISKRNFLFMLANEIMPSLAVYLQQIAIYYFISGSEFIEYRKNFVLITLAVFLGSQSQIYFSKYRVTDMKKMLYCYSVIAVCGLILFWNSPLFLCAFISLVSTSLYCYAKAYFSRERLLSLTLISNLFFSSGFIIMIKNNLVFIDVQYLLLSLTQYVTFLVIVFMLYQSLLLRK